MDTSVPRAAWRRILSLFAAIALAVTAVVVPQAVVAPTAAAYTQTLKNGEVSSPAVGTPDGPKPAVLNQAIRIQNAQGQPLERPKRGESLFYAIESTVRAPQTPNGWGADVESVVLEVAIPPDGDLINGLDIPASAFQWSDGVTRDFMEGHPPAMERIENYRNQGIIRHVYRYTFGPVFGAKRTSGLTVRASLGGCQEVCV